MNTLPISCPILHDRACNARDNILVSVTTVTIMSMETVIRSNTKGMKEIVTKLETTVKEKNKENEEMKTQLDAFKISNDVLERKIEILEKTNKQKERKLRMNEEDIKDLMHINKPLEKAYRSLQRKYQIATDELERKKMNLFQ